MMKNLIFCGLLICLFSSCIQKFVMKKFDNTKWELIELPGTTLPANAKATLNFSEGSKINGKSFCNNYGGQYELNDSKFALKNIFGTKMMCQENDAAEQAYLKALNEVTIANLNNEQLQLIYGDNKKLIFKKVN